MVNLLLVVLGGGAGAGVRHLTVLGVDRLAGRSTGVPTGAPVRKAGPEVMA